jgi:hypothetical protein
MKLFKSKTTDIQTLLFPRIFWNSKTASAWAKKNGFRATKPDVTNDYIRLRQLNPEQFQEKTFRTIDLRKGSKPVKAVVARPWIKVGNPRCILFDTIHKDWKLHKSKHEIYARLAKQKGIGGFTKEKAIRAFKPLVMSAARLYRRKHKVKPKLSVVFPPEKINQGIDALLKEFNTYWKKGNLDQYLPRKAWKKRQEK